MWISFISRSTTLVYSQGLFDATPWKFSPWTYESVLVVPLQKKNHPEGWLFFSNGTPEGIRIPVVRMKTECPRPLDDGGVSASFENNKNYRVSIGK